MERRLSDCTAGTRGRVTALAGEEALCSRLAALGGREGEQVELLKRSPSGRTLLVKTRESVFALGRGAADCVRVDA